MTYKIYNTANTDQYVPISHGVKKAGATGMERNIGSKIKIPGTSKGEDNNFSVIDEGQLRSIFGLYKMVSPGVIDPTKPAELLIQNVTRNRPMLENGRLVVVDGNGNHIFGHGTKEYQAKVSDAALKENQELKDKAANFISILVEDGFTEEQAKAIYDGKMKASDAKLLRDKVYATKDGKGKNTKADKSDKSDKTGTDGEQKVTVDQPEEK